MRLLLPALLAATGAFARRHSLERQGEELQLRTSRLQHEVAEARHGLRESLRGHPEELRHIDRLLREASQMARKAGESQGLASGSRARLAAAEGGQEEDQGAALSTYVTGLSGLTAQDGRLLAETQEARDAIGRALGGESGDFENALERAQAAGHRVIASERRQLRNARHEIKELDERKPAAPVATPRLERQRKRTETSASPSHPVSAKLRRVRAVLDQTVHFASRQSSLSAKGRRLLSRMRELDGEVAEALRKGDKEDVQAVEAFGKHMGRAQGIVRELSQFHGRLAREAKHRAQRLVHFVRRLERDPVHRRKGRLLQRGTARSATAATARAASELRRSRRMLALTAQAESAVEREVRGGGEAAEVRQDVAEALQQAELAEEGSMAAASQSLRRAVARARH